MTDTRDIPQPKTQAAKPPPQYQPDERGYYGDFGGAYIPEMLYHNVETLRRNYLKIMNSRSFQKEYHT